MARGNAGDDSDVDLLVSLPPGKSGLVLSGLLMDARNSYSAQQHREPQTLEVSNVPAGIIADKRTH